MVKIVGHRGLGANSRRPSLPENTVPSLLAATALPQVCGVEFDVVVTADEQLVVFHDFELKMQSHTECSLAREGDTLSCMHTHTGCLHAAEMHPIAPSAANVSVAHICFAQLPAYIPTLGDCLHALLTTEKGFICEVKYAPRGSRRYCTAVSRHVLAAKVVERLASALSGPDADTLQPTWMYLSFFDAELCLETSLCLRAYSEASNLNRVELVFNCWFGHEDEPDEHDFTDPRNSDPRVALDFVREHCRGGMAVEAAWLLANAWFAKAAELEGVKVYTYGTDYADHESIAKQELLGVTMIIADNVDALDMSKS